VTTLLMLVRAPAVCQVMLPVLAWRIQTQAAQAGQRNAINALGTLAAGIAHEINNPVAAMTRATSELDQTMPFLRKYAEAWGKVATPEESEILETARQSWQDRTPGHGRYNALEAAQREDDIQDWLEDHDLEDGSMLAELLSERDLDDEWLEELADRLRPEVLVPALDYLTQSLSIQSHVTEIQEAERRVSGIVRDTKDYTNMDRAPEQDIDVRQGLEATVTMLQGRLGGISVTRDYAEHPPLIMAYPGELNQVWTNLIDNAIAAMDGRGELHLTVRVEGTCVLVEIADNGPGIPDSVLPHIFEPFFTTKDLGQGTGLGLHLSHRIITQRHSGSITVRSEPGSTRFQVRLPANVHEGVACAMPQAATAQETS
jgi:signal transduction histidine kinase